MTDCDCRMETRFAIVDTQWIGVDVIRYEWSWSIFGVVGVGGVDGGTRVCLFIIRRFEQQSMVRWFCVVDARREWLKDVVYFAVVVLWSHPFVMLL